MKRVSRFHDIRTRLLVLVIAVLVVALSSTTLGVNLALRSANDQDLNDSLRSRASVAKLAFEAVQSRRNRISAAPTAVGDSRTWIFFDGRAVERPRSDPRTAQTAYALRGRPKTYETVEATQQRLLALPIVIRGRRRGTVVAAASLQPYLSTERHVLILSVVFLVAVLAASAAAATALLRTAFRPILAMTEQVEAWSVDEPGGRFSLGVPRDELTRLGATLDALLDRVAAAIRHERRLSQEISHELRTPVAAITAEAEVALLQAASYEELRTSMESILGSARRVAQIVETLVATAYSDQTARSVSDVSGAIDRSIAACGNLARAEGVRIVFERPAAPLQVGVATEVVERILHPVLENACRYGSTQVVIAARPRLATVIVEFTDNGDGVLDDEREIIFEPGSRGAARVNWHGGMGLGLALARRIARTASGDVTASPSSNGARFVVTLPAA